MKNFKLLFAFCLISHNCFAQNLVVNPSFENMSECPSSLGAVALANGWHTFSETPDYFDTCITVPGIEVPSNLPGFQFPFDGSAYFGLCTFFWGQLYREFVGSQLLFPLTVGATYHVSMRVSLGGSPGFLTGTNNLGFRFSTVQYDSVIHPAPIDNFAQVYSASIILDTINWVIVSGNFVADSEYKYIIVGNFFDDDHTDTSTIGIYQPIRGYYYIDSIYLAKDDHSGIQGNKPPVFNLHFTGNDLVIHSSFFIKGEITICNTLGQILYSQGIEMGSNSNQRISIGNFSPGVYVAFIQSKQGDFSDKFFK